MITKGWIAPFSLWKKVLFDWWRLRISTAMFHVKKRSVYINVYTTSLCYKCFVILMYESDETISNHWIQKRSSAVIMITMYKKVLYLIWSSPVRPLFHDHKLRCVFTSFRSFRSLVSHSATIWFIERGMREVFRSDSCSINHVLFKVVEK